MLGRVFPQAIGRTYQGPYAALLFLVPVLLFKTVIAVNFSGLNPFVDVATILKTVDAVPLDTFGAEAADTVVSFSQLWGKAMVVLCLVVWGALFVYRAGLPLAILLLLMEQAMRTGDRIIPVLRDALATGQLPSLSNMINLTMTAFLVIAFGLSLLAVRRDKPIS
jgi:hypothetical protein